MTQIDQQDLSFDDWDELNFPRETVQDFDRVVERAVSRRGFLGGVLAFGSGHLMQTVLAAPKSQKSVTPEMPIAPEEAQIPVVLKTPPKPRIPATFG